MMHNKGLLEMAQAYFKRGLTPYPCHAVRAGACTCERGAKCASPGKHPVGNWKRFQTKPIDADQLEIWFGRGSMYENHNIGIITGAISKVFVVDVDIGEGKAGAESLHALQMANEDLPSTMTTKTGSGGQHYFYRMPDDATIVTDSNVLGQGIDIRGEGGFVVAGGSVHRNGELYQCDFDELTDAPNWLLDQVTTGAMHAEYGHKLQESVRGDHPFKTTDGRESFMVRVVVRTIFAHFEEHHTLPTVDQIVERGWPQYEDAVKARGASLAADGRGLDQFVEKATYQLKRGKRGDLRVLEALKARIKAEGIVTKPPRSDPTEFDFPTKPTVVAPPRLLISDWSFERYMGEPAPMKWLIEGVAEMGVAGLFCAQGGLGKSFMMLDLAINVASGGNEWHEVAPTFMGNKIKNFGKVVYLSAEDSQGTIHRRLKSITTPEQYERLKENLTLIPLPDAGGVFPIIKQDSGGLHITQAYQDLFDQLREIEGLVLIIFDPLQAMVHADITSDPTAGQYWWTQMAKLCAETQATVIVTHHMRKEGSQTIRTAADARAAMRGSTALVDGARFAFAIWPASTEQNSEWSHALNVDPDEQLFLIGAMVKSNAPHDKRLHVHMRNEAGLPRVITERLEEALQGSQTLTQMQIAAICKEVDMRFEQGRPFNPNPNARTYSLADYLMSNYGLPKHKALSRVEQWVSQGFFISDKCAAAGSGYRGLRSHTQENKYAKS